MRITKNRTGGFTLIELALVIAIIGILAAIAIPKYMNYQCRSRQVEARGGLGSLAKMQQAYYTEFNTYAIHMDSIGFSTKGESRYEYSMTAVTANSYEAKALSLAPGISSKGAGDDEWTINDQLILVNTKNPCYGK